MKRGIITNSGKMSRIDTDSVSINGSISDIDVNYYLLYWDTILMPTNNIIHIAVNREEELLKTGIFERPKVNFSSWSSKLNNGAYDPFVVAQSIVANDIISKDKTTEWTIHQIGEQIAIGNEQRQEFDSIKVELINCLPVPSENINFQDILEFKEKRKNELLALHSTIDDLYIDILNSPDKDFQKRKNISELTKAIENIDAVSNEKFNILSKYNFTTELNINGKDLAVALGGGAAFDFFTSGLTIPIGTVIAGIASLIKIKASKTISVEKAKCKLKLNYLADANKGNIIKN